MEERMKKAEKPNGAGRVTVEMAQAALERAVAYATEHKIPLTLERLAVELDMEIARIRTMSDPAYSAGWGERGVCAVLRRARREVQASVTEFALSRGSGAQAHLQYLTHMTEESGGNEGATVVFLNEDKV